MPLPVPQPTEIEVHAVRALVKGEASKDQQLRAVEWLMTITGIRGVPYVPGSEGERDTLVLIGQHRIGVLIANMLAPETLTQAQASDRERARGVPAPTRRASKRQPK